jgi:SM-20-related protein
MRVRSADQVPEDFSFHDERVLLIDEFWTPEEAKHLRSALAAAPKRNRLLEMDNVSRTFPNCGNWLKAEMPEPDLAWFAERTLLPCVNRHAQTFEGVVGGMISFQYYTYGVGDGLSLHDDTDSGDDDDPERGNVKRRIAVATYLHERWDSNWGGELVLYDERPPYAGAQVPLQPREFIAPSPGSLAMFAVPRLHRVCRVDPLAGEHQRLSVAGWFMTRHQS